tara:strand:- start:454 stop:705 length:252 start_codon:yes stop_codon:yes gene_type:complete
MAKGKTSSKTHYVSKGIVGVNKELSKAVKRERSELDNTLNAWKSWIKGSPTPRCIQKSLGITSAVSHRDWTRRNQPKVKTANE